MTHQELCNAWLTPAVNCWYKDQIRNIHQRFYFYFKPSKGSQAGSMVIAPEPLNKDWELATSEPVPRHLTRDQVYHWAFEISRRLPILPVE